MKKILLLIFIILPLFIQAQNISEVNGVALTNLSEVDGVPVANIAEINGVPFVLSTLKDGLLAGWDFDETSGTVADDSYSTYDGTNNSVTINEAGLLDRCYYFNTVRCNVTAAVSLNVQDSFSISTWVKTGATADFSGIVPFRQDGGIYSGISMRSSAGGGVIYVYNYTTSAASVEGTVNVIDNNWHHVVFTYASDSLRLYIDGSQNGATAQTGNTGNNSTVVIGYDNILTSRYYTGYLDQTFIWTKRLTNEEITQIYNSGNGLPYASFGFWWLILLIRVRKNDYLKMAA